MTTYGNIVQHLSPSSCLILFYLQVISDTALGYLRSAFMDAFDENEDDKIEISEVSTKCLYNILCYFKATPFL